MSNSISQLRVRMQDNERKFLLFRCPCDSSRKEGKRQSADLSDYLIYSGARTFLFPPGEYLVIPIIVEQLVTTVRTISSGVYS